jgi:UDP-glucose 4-epimerase
LKVLIAGGAGFIGSTIASACIDAGMTPVLLDNLVTGRAEFTVGRTFYPGDISDRRLIDTIFGEHPDIAAVIHCAALIVVPESVTDPIRYYRENVAKGVEFYEQLVRNGCERLIFSSSASIYEPGEDFSVDEESPIAPMSPYARTKALYEAALRDFTLAAAGPRVISLRYFNPIGADPKLRTGLQVPRPSHALGKLIEALRADQEFSITGVDWPTRDGSGIRDYIHVWDLAQAHVEVLRRFDEVLGSQRYDVLNLGTGTGTTVRELLAAFETVIGRALPAREAPPRPGDAVGAYTRTSKVESTLEWRPSYSLEDGIRDTLRWFDVRDDVLRAG